MEDTEAGKGGDVCIIMADLHRCMAETIKIKDKNLRFLKLIQRLKSIFKF